MLTHKAVASSVIETQQLTRRFGALTAVDHPNLNVARGSV